MRSLYFHHPYIYFETKVTARENSKFCKKGGIESRYIILSKRDRERKGERGVHASGGLINHRAQPIKSRLVVIRAMPPLWGGGEPSSSGSSRDLGDFDLERDSPTESTANRTFPRSCCTSTSVSLHMYAHLCVTARRTGNVIPELLSWHVARADLYDKSGRGFISLSSAFVECVYRRQCCLITIT